MFHITWWQRAQLFFWGSLLWTLSTIGNLYIRIASRKQVKENDD